MRGIRRQRRLSLPIIVTCLGLCGLAAATLTAQADPATLFDTFALDVAPTSNFEEHTIGDADNDGLNELVVTALDELLYIVSVLPDGTWAIEQQLQLPTGVIPAVEWISPHVVDIDGDGDNDLVVWARRNNFQGALAVGTFDAGVFTFETFVTPETDAGYRMAIGDMNGDGLPDAMTTNGGFSAPGTLFILYNDPDPALRFTTFEALPMASDATKAFAIDLDGDGDVDGAAPTHDTATNAARLFFNEPASFTVLDLFPGNGTRSSNMAFGDLDNDGDVDIVTNATVPHVDENWVYLRASGGYATPFLFRTSGQRAESHQIADFDRDGLNDLVVSVAADRTLDFFFGDPLTGILSTNPQTLSTPELTSFDHGLNGNPNASAVGDVDNDGDLDIVMTFRTSVLLLNTTCDSSPASCIDVDDSDSDSDSDSDYDSDGDSGSDSDSDSN